MNYTKNDKKREEKQVAILEEILGVDFVRFNISSAEKRAKGIKELSEEYSVLDEAMMLDIFQGLTKDNCFGGLEIKSIERKKEWFSDVILDVSKLEEIESLLKQNRIGKIYVVYFYYNGSTNENIIKYNELSEELVLKGYKDIYPNNVLVFDADELIRMKQSLKKIVHRDKAGTLKQSYKISKDMSIDLYELKGLLNDFKHDKIGKEKSLDTGNI